MMNLTNDNKHKPLLRQSRGFTLIEVLAALVLIIVVIPVVMKGISLATAVASDSARKSVAAELAQSQMAEILLQKQWQSSTLTGDFGTEYPDYRWRMTSASWTDPSLKEVTVEVMWQWRGYERKVQLTTLVRIEDEQPGS